MYKVFIHNKPLEIIGLNDPIEQAENMLVLRVYHENEIDSVSNVFEHVPSLEKVVLLCDNPEQAFEALKKNSN